MANQIVENICTRCKETKAITEFYRAAQNKSGYQSICKSCHLARQRTYRKGHPQPSNVEQHLWYRYKMRGSEYEAMVIRQKNLCAICKKPPATSGRHIRLQVDHCHETGHIRGLLCNSCNNALGRFGDSIEGIQRVLDYLKAAKDIDQPNQEGDRRPRGEEHHWNTNPEGRMKGEKHPCSMFSEETAKEILRRAQNGENQYELAAEFGISQPTVSAIKVGRNWGHLQDES